jgi:hypothetical protein
MCQSKNFLIGKLRMLTNTGDFNIRSEQFQNPLNELALRVAVKRTLDSAFSITAIASQQVGMPVKRFSTVIIGSRMAHDLPSIICCRQKAGRIETPLHVDG